MSGWSEGGASDALKSLEDAHPVLRHRRRVLHGLTGRIGDRDSIRSILDGGCGTGALTADVARSFPQAHVTGLDITTAALNQARTRLPARYVRGSLEALPFRGAVFDLVVLSDVLEHCRNDRKVLFDLAGAVRSGGWLLLSVPAGGLLWTSDDEAAGHWRRYSRRALVRELAEMGFGVIADVPFQSPGAWKLLARWKPWRRLPSSHHGEGTMPDPSELFLEPGDSEAWRKGLDREWQRLSAGRRPLLGTELAVLAQRTRGERREKPRKGDGEGRRNLPQRRGG